MITISSNPRSIASSRAASVSVKSFSFGREMISAFDVHGDFDESKSPIIISGVSPILLALR